MSSKRIKKPVRKNKSDYPGEMSFRKALGMNPTYYQEGGDYNMQRALELGYTSDEAGHYPSVDSETGMWLKSKQHPTAWMESMYGYQLNPEVYNNYNVTYNPEGYFGENQLQYVPKKKFGGKLHYQDAGKLPTLYVDPNDPANRARYQAYQDSLSLYNRYIDLYNQALNTNAGTREQVARRYNIQQDPRSQNQNLYHLIGTNQGSSPQYMYARNTNNVNPNILPIAARSYADDSRARVSPFLAEYKKPVEPVKYKLDPEIVKKQKLLKEAGLYKGKIDGVWGTNSQTAWDDYQKQLNVTPASDKQSNTVSRPYRNFARETITQVPYRNPSTGETEDRIILSTPKHEYHMTPGQYSNLLPTDSIPKQGNFLYRKNRKNGGKLYYQEDIGELPTVKYGTPEYEQAYNQGILATRLSGDPQDFVRARTLPEFKVTPQYTSLSDDLRYLALEGSKGLAELTGVPGTVRFARNPVQSLKGAGNTLVDLGMTIAPFARMNPAGGIQYATQGVNPLTGEGSYRAEDVEGAFNTLDAAGLATIAGAGLKTPVQQGLSQTGKYLTQGPLRNAWRLNPNALKNPDLILTRTQKPGQTLELKRLEELKDWGEKYGFENMDPYSLMEYESLSKPGYGRGFSSDLMHIDYYSNPYVQGTRGYEGLPEILKIRLPAKEAAKFNVKLNPLEGYESYAPGKEFLLPEDLVYSAESFIPTKRASYGPGTISNITRTLDKEQKLANTPHWWKGYPQVEVPRQLPGSPNAISSVEPYRKGFIDFKGALQKYPKGPITQEEIAAYKNSPYYKKETQQYLDFKNKYGDSWTLPNYAEENLQEAIETGNRGIINSIVHGGRNWGASDYIIAGLAGTSIPGTTGVVGLAFSPAVIKNKFLNAAGITSRPDLLSSKDTTINITNRPMDFAKVNETADGKIIIGGEFIESANNTVRKAKDWLTATDTYSDQEYPSKDIQSFYGIENGKFKVGKASEFNPNTEIVPRRFGAINIKKAVLNDGAMRLLDHEGKPIYQNTPNTGKFILYSPSTKEAEFNYINTGKSGVEKVNKFLKKNKDAQYIHLDNGRYEFYGLNPEGLSGADFRQYYEQDWERENNPGYNMIIKKDGGSLPKAQPGLQTQNPNEVKYGTPEYEEAYNQGTLTTRLSGDPEDFVRAKTIPAYTFEYKDGFSDLPTSVYTGPLNYGFSIPIPNKGLRQIHEIDYTSDFSYDNSKNQINLDKAYNFATQWMSSPRYRQMLSNSGGTDWWTNAADVAKARINNLNQIQKSPLYIKNDPNVTLTKNQLSGVGGYSNSLTGNIYVKPKEGAIINTLYDHEVSHSIDRPINNNLVKDFIKFYSRGMNYEPRLIPSKDINLMKTLVDPSIPQKNPITFWEKYGNTPEKGTRNYYSNPTEVRARLNEIREILNEYGVDVFNKKITPAHYKIIKDYGPIKDLKNIYSDDNIIRLLNSISYAKPKSIDNNLSNMFYGQSGGSLPRAQMLGGKLKYARGGSLTSAQDTAQAADLNQDVMRKDTKKASAFEDFMAFNYGVGAGFLDTISFGATDELTDAGFKALQSAAGHDVNSEEAKRQAGLKGWGNIGGAVGGAFLNPGAMGSAIEEGTEGLGQGIKGIDPNSPTATGIGTALEGMGSTKAFTGLNDKDKIPEGMEGFSKIFMARNGGRFRYGYQGGGHMLNQNMGLTEIDGPSHEEGGVTLPNNGGRPDVEVEGPETIYTPENYVMSEKMKASLEALEFAGITGKAARRLAGKSYADLSKMIKSKAGDKLRPNDPLSKKMLDKEMKRLMKAHEYDREVKRMKDEAMRSQMMGGSNIVAETPEERAGGYNMYPNAESIAFPGSGPTSVVPTYNNDPIMVTGADGSQQMLTDEPIETEAPFIEQKMAQGGKMIKRADGSYSRRGLWDNIRANRGSGRKPTKQMLEQEAKIKAAEKAYGGYYADGGSFDNPGFRALPDYVQAKIKSNMALGGFMGDYIDEDDTMEYGSGGYTVRRSNDRKGKTHVVTGPDGTKKYFGDPKLGERGKSKYGKKGFYARHKKNLAKNPYFRAYARATWEDGGYMNMLDSNVDMVDMETPMYEYGGSMMYGQGGGIHIDPSKRGTFKAQASRMGMGVQEAARTILNAPEGKYSPAMRKKANFARNFAKADGGYMYQMGGEMMPEEMMAAEQQAGMQQEQPQGGGQEQIIQAIVQMLQQGLQPEQIVGELVKMGVPQEAAIQVVQMVMQQVQQSQGMQQQQQAAPPFEQGMMGQQQGAPATMRGGGRMYQMGGSLADTYLQNLNKPKPLFRNGGKLYYQQDQGYLIPNDMYSSKAVSTPDDYERIYDIVGNTLDRETNLGYSNYGFTQPGATQYANTKEGRDQAINAAIDQYFNKYGLYEMPDSQQAMAFDFAFNSEDPRASMMVAANKLTPAEKVSMYSQGKLDPDKVNQAWKKYGANVMAMGDALNDPFADEKIRSYTGTRGANTKLPEWTNRVNQVKAFAPKYFSNNNSQSNSLYTSVPIPAGVPSTTTSSNTAVGSTSTGATTSSTPAGKPEKYQEWQPNTAPIVAGGIAAGITPIANLVASITGRDTRAAAPLKFEKPDYTPVAIQRAAANQALANTREALRRGAPTQGNYLSNLTVTAPSLAANVGREIAGKRFEIGKSRAEIDMRQQLANDQIGRFNLMNQGRDQAAREQLRLEAAKGFSTIGQGVTKDLGETLYEANILRNLETKDFSPFNYIKDEKGRFKQVLSPRGAALYRDNTTNNQIVTDNQGNKYMILPGGKIQLIQE